MQKWTRMPLHINLVIRIGWSNTVRHLVKIKWLWNCFVCWRSQKWIFCLQFLSFALHFLHIKFITFYNKKQLSQQFAFDRNVLKSFDKFWICWNWLKFKYCRIRTLSLCYYLHSFLPHEACVKHGLSCHVVSVCLSVTFVHSVEAGKHIVRLFSPSGRPIILVFAYQIGRQ